MADIGHIERVPLREVWPHEAYDFTQWLGENIDALSEELGITLADAEVLARVVLHRALKQGIHPKTLRRAAAALGISQENGTIYRKGHREWWWKLPEPHQPEPPEILMLPSGL